MVEIVIFSVVAFSLGAIFGLYLFKIILDLADTKLAIANSLESMIESNIFDPKLLSNFREARQKMAKTYAYEGATDFNTGMIDVNKLSRITSKDNAMTGDIAALGKIAGNFPDAFAVVQVEVR